MTLDIEAKTKYQTLLFPIKSGDQRFSVYPSHQFSLVGCIFVTSAVGSPTNDDRNPILFADRELLCTMVWKFYKRTFPPFKMVTSLTLLDLSTNLNAKTWVVNKYALLPLVRISLHQSLYHQKRETPYLIQIQAHHWFRRLTWKMLHGVWSNFCFECNLML